MYAEQHHVGWMDGLPRWSQIWSTLRCSLIIIGQFWSLHIKMIRSFFSGWLEGWLRSLLRSVWNPVLSHPWAFFHTQKTFFTSRFISHHVQKRIFSTSVQRWTFKVATVGKWEFSGVGRKWTNGETEGGRKCRCGWRESGLFLILFLIILKFQLSFPWQIAHDTFFQVWYIGHPIQDHRQESGCIFFFISFFFNYIWQASSKHFHATCVDTQWIIRQQFWVSDYLQLKRAAWLLFLSNFWKAADICICQITFNWKASHICICQIYTCFGNMIFVYAFLRFKQLLNMIGRLVKLKELLIVEGKF